MTQFSPKPESRESTDFRKLFPYFKAVCIAKSMDYQGGKPLLEQRKRRES